MDYSNAFRLVNLGVGAVMVLGGISQFFSGISIHNVVIGVYTIIFGLATVLLEFQIPPYMSRYASFLFSFLGRGIFYLFVGCLILDGHVLRYIAGSIVGFVGVAYIALEYVPSIEPPSNMRDSEAGWGAEQV